MDPILLNQNFENSGLIEKYTSLQWIRRYYDVGNFELHVSPEYFDQVMASRYIYHSENDETAIIEDVSFQQNQAGTSDLVLKGRFLEALLYDRVINRTETLSGNLETALRNLIVKYAMTGERKIPLLQLSQAKGFGETINLQTTGAVLMEKLYATLQSYEMSFKLHYDYLKNIIYFSIWKGVDRTQSQDENTWAIFSNSFENVLDTVYNKNDADYKNFAYVAGSGEDNNRVVEEVNLIKPGEIRRELYVDARDLQPQDENGNAIPIATYRAILHRRGLEKLNEFRKIEAIDGKVDIQSNLKYREDFDLGDLCNYENPEIGLSVQKRLTEIQEIYENGLTTVNTVFGEDYVTSIKKVIQKEVM